MKFRMWCRWGELPLDAADEEAAIAEAVSFALRNGVFVVLMTEDGYPIVEIPPAPQSNMIIPLLFDGLSPESGYVGRN
jgi:hypothetical protein